MFRGAPVPRRDPVAANPDRGEWCGGGGETNEIGRMAKRVCPPACTLLLLILCRRDLEHWLDNMYTILRTVRSTPFLLALSTTASFLIVPINLGVLE